MRQFHGRKQQCDSLILKHVAALIHCIGLHFKLDWVAKSRFIVSDKMNDEKIRFSWHCENFVDFAVLLFNSYKCVVRTSHCRPKWHQFERTDTKNRKKEMLVATCNWIHFYIHICLWQYDHWIHMHTSSICCDFMTCHKNNQCNPLFSRLFQYSFSVFPSRRFPQQKRLS